MDNDALNFYHNALKSGGCADCGGCPIKKELLRRQREQKGNDTLLQTYLAVKADPSLTKKQKALIIRGIRKKAKIEGGAELHAYLWADNKLKRASYMGPGTDIIGRLKRNVAPVSGADKVAMAHDLRYTLANGSVSAERDADIRMVKKLKDTQLDNRLNRAIGYIPIRAKMLAEDAGLFPKGRMSRGAPLTPTDLALVRDNLARLESQGFGLY